MKSMSDLLLKTHFNELKEELNNAIISAKNADDPKEIKVLKSVFHYLKKKAESGQLDDLGHVLYHDIAKVLDDFNTCPKQNQK